MEQKKEEKSVYPVEARLVVYLRLLEVLFQQNKISKGTYAKSTKHVESVIEKKM